LLDDAAASRAQGLPPLHQSFGGADAGQTILFSGEVSEDVYVLCLGWAIRAMQLPDGRRQILSIALPGDLLSPRLLFTQVLGSAIHALTPVRFSRLSRSELSERLRAKPALFEGFIRSCLAECEAADELLADLGQRTSDERVARLLLRVAAQHHSRNVARDRQQIRFPMRQQDIGDMLGLTSVHVSRVLRKLRQSGLIAIAAGSFEIRDQKGLERIARGG
jgi:CRP-like cAMP-binding protein